MACKEEGMVNVVSRKCHCGRAVPNFGAAGQKKRTHCAQCKEPGMVNLSKNPAARQPLPQIPVGPPPMMLSPQDAMIGMHAHHQVSMGQQVTHFVPYQEQCYRLDIILLGCLRILVHVLSMRSGYSFVSADRTLLPHTSYGLWSNRSFLASHS